jgi:hypothetical protein
VFNSIISNLKDKPLLVGFFAFSAFLVFAFFTFKNEKEVNNLQYVLPAYKYLEEHECFSNINSYQQAGRRTTHQRFIYVDEKSKPHNLFSEKKLSAEGIAYHTLSGQVIYYCAKGNQNIVTNILFEDKFLFENLNSNDLPKLKDTAKNNKIALLLPQNTQ